MELLHCKEPGQNVGPEPGPTGRTDRSDMRICVSVRSWSGRIQSGQNTKGRTGRTDRSDCIDSAQTVRRFACGFPQCSLENPDRSGGPVGGAALVFEAVAPTGSVCSVTYWNGRTGRADRSGMASTADLCMDLRGCLRQDLPVCHSVGWRIKGNIITLIRVKQSK